VNETLWNAVLASVFAVGAMGITTGLVVELGGVARIPQRWRRFIGMAPGELGPPRPRAWTLLIGFGLLLALEAPIYLRLVEARERSDIPSALVLAVHVVALVGWLAYLGIRPPRV
jgi:hypothetical protein